jgi:hypothetical protein
MKLHAEWRWIINHAWSVRLILLAFVLSGAEAILPLFTDYSHPVLYAVATALITGGAFAARLVAQKRVLGAILDE